MKGKGFLSRFWVFLLVVFTAVGIVSEATAAKTVTAGLFPFGAGRMVDDWILDNGVHKKWGAKVGVNFKITHPRDDFAAFMGKSIEIVALSTLEIGRLVGDEGHDIVQFGKQVDAIIDWYVRSDSPYKTAADLKGKKVVHPGWSTGTAQMSDVLLKAWYGIEMKKDMKVVSAPWPVGPKLLAKGDVEMAMNLVPLSMGLWRAGKIRPILATAASVWAKKRNTSHNLSITNFLGWGKWVRGNEKIARAWLSLYSEGQKYAHENTVAWATKYRNRIKKNASDAELAWFIKWFKKHGVVYKEANIDETFISEETAFLQMCKDAGYIKKVLGPESWKILKLLD